MTETVVHSPYDAPEVLQAVPASAPLGMMPWQGGTMDGVASAVMGRIERLEQTTGRKVWPWALAAGIGGAIAGALAGYMVGGVVCRMKRVVGH